MILCKTGNSFKYELIFEFTGSNIIYTSRIVPPSAQSLDSSLASLFHSVRLKMKMNEFRIPVSHNIIISHRILKHKEIETLRVFTAGRVYEYLIFLAKMEILSI